MPFRNYLFKRVTIIGVGLIGGSLGMAIKRHNLAQEVVGVSQKQTSLTAALKNQAIDQAAQDMKKAVNSADLVILATPVSVISTLIPAIAPHLRRHCIVTDVGSTKLAIVQAAQKHLSNNPFFVGSHPLAGSEKQGVQFATADLFAESLCIMTPTDVTHRYAREKIKQLWTAVGAKVKMMPPDEHDKVLSYISHLPHLVAYALMNTIPPELLEYAARGLKDTTRISSSSPAMWNDICLSNVKNITTVLDDFVRNLSATRKCMTSYDQKNLTEQFRLAKAKRDSLQ